MTLDLLDEIMSIFDIFWGHAFHSVKIIQFLLEPIKFLNNFHKHFIKWKICVWVLLKLRF